MRFEKRLATALSYAFHPLLMPTVSLLVILQTPAFFSYSIPEQVKNILYFFVFFTTSVVPAFFSYWLYRNNKISDLVMSDKNDRRLPYLITAISYGITYYFLQKLPLPKIILLMVLGANLAVTITLLINLKWKISAHTVGIGGLTGALIGIAFRLMMDLHTVIMLFVFISGLVAYARLKLQAHTPAQVYIGYLLGFVTQLSLFIF